MRRFIVFLIATCFMSIAMFAFSGGSGTENDPFVIMSAEDLLSIPDRSTDCFILKADIPSFAGTEKIFCGKFDGNGFSITLEQHYENGVDSNYDIGSDPQYWGIFTECIGATFTNLTINGTQDITTRNYAMGDIWIEYWNRWSNFDCYFYFKFTQVYIGSICGKATSTTFMGCVSSSRIKFAVSSNNYSNKSKYIGIASESWFGGIVGLAVNCNFSECSASGTINTDLISDLSKDLWISDVKNKIQKTGCGGLAGGIEQSTISDSFSTISITDDDNLSLCAGGLVGVALKSELNCSYVHSSVLGEDKSSGAFVYLGDSKLKNCISYSDNTQQINDLKFENCFLTTIEEETDQLKSVSPVMLSIEQWYKEKCPNWDFENIWYLPATSDALPIFRVEPVLSWEGFAKYGSTISFKSTNSYAKLEILPEESSKISVNGSSITFNKSGETRITVIQASVTPYKPINKSIIFDVEKLPLSISAKNVEIEYGNTINLDNILTFEGFINDDDENSLKSLPTILCGATQKSDVGTYNIVLQGGDADNYEFILTNGSVNVVPRSLIVTPRDCSRKYGSSNPNFTLDFNGFAEGQNESMITEIPIATTQANERSDVGEYNIVCNGGTVHPNYKFVYNNGILTIQKANLIIKAEDKERGVGEYNPTFTLTYNGFRNDDDEFTLEQLPFIHCDANIDSPAGIYPIILEGGLDKNYEYQLQNGILNIKERNVEEVIINKTELRLIEGETATLSVTIKPEDAMDKSLTWTSLDESIAIVSNEGTVTAVNVGTTTITAASSNGKSATCKVTVLPILVESLNIDPMTWSGEEGSEFKITAIVLPGNASDKTLIWTSSDEAIATVDSDGNVKVMKEGNCVITVSTVDGSELTSECVITSVSVVDAIFSEDVLVDVFDIRGVMLKHHCDRDDLKQLQSGVYIIRYGSMVKTIYISNK